MFRKLVSNLPFQPSLLSDVAFYAHRLRKEHAVRRLGFTLILVGFGIQIFAVAFPPESSLATNAGDIIYGATSKKDVLTAYRKDQDQLGRKDIRAIFNHYGIGEAQIEKATPTTIKDSNKNYINTSRSTTKFADTFVPIEGAVDGGIYEFPLDYWRKNEFPNGYPALTGISTYGYRFWILLKGCGNIVFEKGAKKPTLEIQKQLTSSPSVTEGGTITYDIRFRNTGAVPAADTKIVDTLPDNLRYVSYKSSVDVKFKKSGNTLTWRIDTKNNALAPSTRWHQITLTARADSSTTGKKQCNSVQLSATNAKKADAVDQTCVTIAQAVCPGTGLPVPAGGLAACQVNCPDGSFVPYSQACAVPQLSCSNLDIIPTDVWQKKSLATTVSLQPGAQIKEVNYYVNDAKIATITAPGNTGQYVAEHTFSTAGSYQIRSEIVASAGQLQPGQNCSTSLQISPPSDDNAVIVTDKNVRNITQNIADANNTVANPGDTLTYTVTVTNKGGRAVENLALSGEYAEDISDILEYATITELNDGMLNKESGKISWPAVTVIPGQTITKTFSVQVKNPLPATPISLSDPLSFDFEMHNTYGRTVVVKLNKPASKVAEQTANTLPNTGPGTTLLVSTLIVIVVAYFYYRNKLLAKELLIIQREFQTGGL